MTVRADPRHRRGLRPFVAELLGEPDLVADGEPVVIIEHAVAMEVDLASIGREVAPLTLDVDVRHAGVRRLDVRLHVSTQTLRVIRELPPRGPERIADRHVGVLVCAVERVIAADHDVRARHRQGHEHADALAAVVVLVRALDHHVTALDPVVDVFQLAGPTTHEIFDRGARFHVAKRDIQLEWHADNICMGRADVVRICTELDRQA